MLIGFGAAVESRRDALQYASQIRQQGNTETETIDIQHLTVASQPGCQLLRALPGRVPVSAGKVNDRESVLAGILHLSLSLDVWEVLSYSTCHQGVNVNVERADGAM